MHTTTTPNNTAMRHLRQIKRANFRRIELELQGYYLSRKMLAESLVELNVIADSTIVTRPPDEERVQSSGYLSDIVASRVIEVDKYRTHTLMVLKETARWLDAIAYMLDQLKIDPEPRKQDLVRLKYFENRLTDEGIQMELGISESTFRRWRRQVVEMVATRLGLLV